MGLGALLAEIELATENFSAALLNLAHDAEVRRQHPITELSPVVGPVQTEDLGDLDHQRSMKRWSRVSAAICSALRVRCV
jgi:hypothetical protein